MDYGRITRERAQERLVPAVQEEKALGIMAWAAQEKGQEKVGSCP